MKMNCTVSISLLNLSHKIVHGRGNLLIPKILDVVCKKLYSSFPADFIYSTSWKYFAGAAFGKLS